MSGLLNKLAATSSAILPSKVAKTRKLKTDACHNINNKNSSNLIKPVSNQFTKLLAVTKYLPAGLAAGASVEIECIAAK